MSQLKVCIFSTNHIIVIYISVSQVETDLSDGLSFLVYLPFLSQAELKNLNDFHIYNKFSESNTYVKISNNCCLL